MYVQEDVVDVCEQLLNQLVLLQPPGFIYAAKPPEGASRAGRRARQRRAGAAAAAAAGLEDDDESATVYGSYAAVMLCDGRCVAVLYQLLSRQHVLHHVQFAVFLLWLALGMHSMQLAKT
jgi:hypothetical protein